MSGVEHRSRAGAAAGRRARATAGTVRRVRYLLPDEEKVLASMHRVDDEGRVRRVVRAQAALLLRAELPAVVDDVPPPVDRRQLREGRDVRKEAVGGVLALDPVRRGEAAGGVVVKVVDEARAGDPLDELVAHAPEEARRVRVGPDRVLAVRQVGTLDRLRPGRLQWAEAVAAGLEVGDGVGAP